MIGFVLNGFVFVLIGLELPHDPRGPRGPTAGRAPRPRGRSSAGSSSSRGSCGSSPRACCPVRRAGSIARRDPRLATRLTFVVSWAGLRGAVSLAAALALPATFPERNLILLLTFAVILVTLVGQGLTLPRVLRWADWDGVEPDGDEATWRAPPPTRPVSTRSQRAREDWPGHQPLFDRLESGLRDRTQHLATEDPDETAERTPGAGRARGDPARRHRAPSGRPSSSCAIAARSTT